MSDSPANFQVSATLVYAYTRLPDKTEQIICMVPTDYVRFLTRCFGGAGA
jgi:hypothetical protein